jgi:hypothetical protein
MTTVQREHFTLMSTLLTMRCWMHPMIMGESSKVSLSFAHMQALLT